MVPILITFSKMSTVELGRIFKCEIMRIRFLFATFFAFTILQPEIVIHSCHRALYHILRHANIANKYQVIDKISFQHTYMYVLQILTVKSYIIINYKHVFSFPRVKK